MNLLARTDRPRAVPEAVHQHVVEFYDSETFLVGTVAGFVGPALNDGDAAIVVATPAHRSAFEAALRTSGVDLASAVATDRYLAFDARECLGTFMAGGTLDPEHFAEMVGGAIERAAAGGRRVRIYGEMVALLWDDGDVVSAIAHEDLWNDVATDREFMLLCAYPMRAFADADSGIPFRRICDQHSTVIPSEDYAMLGGDDVEQRVAAEMQQEAAVLKAELTRLRAERTLAAAAYGDQLLSELPLGPRPPAPSPRAALLGSPGGRLLVESLGTLSNRLRYAEGSAFSRPMSSWAQRSEGTASRTSAGTMPTSSARSTGARDATAS